MDASTTHSSSGRNVRQKRAHSSSSNIRLDETASKAGEPISQGSKDAASGSTAAAAAASRVHASHKHVARAKSVKKENTSPSRFKSAQADAEAQQNTAILDGLKADVGNIRSTLHCRICTKLLFEPYTTTCGHTYCYTCLCQWFESTARKKTCPDCRAIVTHPPAPAYLVKEIVGVFVAKPELFPPSETPESLQKARKEEADNVQKDKDNKNPRTGGLFRGLFRRAPFIPRPIRDEEDGVDRCPFCNWEIEDGQCNNCGGYTNDDHRWGNGFRTVTEDGLSSVSGVSEAYEEDLEMIRNLRYLDATDHLSGWVDESEDHDDWGDLGHDGWGNSDWGPADQRFRGPPRNRQLAMHSAAGSRRRSYSGSVASSLVSDPLMEEDEDEGSFHSEDSSMSGFIVDETASERERHASVESDTPQPESMANQRRRRARRVVDSDEEEEGEEQQDESDEGPIVPSRRHRRLNRQPSARRITPATVSSPASSSVVTTGTVGNEGESHMENGGWSPLQPTDDGEDYGDESDGAITTVGWEPTLNPNDRTRNGGSLTPTADRPHGAIRRARSRILDGSRGLRRRSSVMSNASRHYDNEADDDLSEPDQVTDASSRFSQPRRLPELAPQRSAIRLRQSNHMLGHRPSTATLGTMDSDDSEELHYLPNRRGRRVRQPEYNPIISSFFAEHEFTMRTMATHQGLPPFPQFDDERSATPVARPRTSNRNRRTSRLDLAGQANGNPAAAAGGPQGPRTRTPANGTAANPRPLRNAARAERRIGVAEVDISLRNPAAVGPGPRPNDMDRPELSTFNDQLSPSESSSADSSPPAARPAGVSAQRPYLPAMHDAVARPPSAMPSRPWPNIATAMGSLNRGQPTVGLNPAQRAFAAPSTNPFMSMYAMPRPPTQQRLREQPSSQTIRQQSSQRRLNGQQQQMNPRSAPAHVAGRQASRPSLRIEQSRHQLQGQAPPRNVMPSVSAVSQASSSRSSSAMTEDEVQRRASELIQNRTQELRDSSQLQSNSDYQQRQFRANVMHAQMQAQTQARRSNPFRTGTQPSNTQGQSNGAPQIAPPGSAENLLRQGSSSVAGFTPASSLVGSMASRNSQTRPTSQVGRSSVAMHPPTVSSSPTASSSLPAPRDQRVLGALPPSHGSVRQIGPGGTQPQPPRRR